MEGIMELIRMNAQDKKTYKQQVDQYLGFYHQVYQGNVHYRDSLRRVLRSILLGKAAICQSSWFQPLLVTENGNVKAVCTLAVVDRLDQLLQITYFEALPHQEKAVELILQEADRVATQKGIPEISVGLNFHVNYGLGILTSHHDSTQSFGSAYHPPEYGEYFRPHADRIIHLTSYITNMKQFKLTVSDRLMQRIKQQYTVRKADFSNIKKEAQLYTNLNNAIFSDHPFYYPRRVQEDLELFKDFRLFLKPENLLFLEHQGQAIGFMLWYPDFNQLIPPGGSVGLSTLLKNFFLGSRIRQFKIVELGVLPSYQKTGAVLNLFDACHQLTKGRYQWCEAGWILEENIASTGFGKRWADKPYKKYQVYLLQPTWVRRKELTHVSDV